MVILLSVFESLVASAEKIGRHEFLFLHSGAMHVFVCQATVGFYVEQGAASAHPGAKLETMEGSPFLIPGLVTTKARRDPDYSGIKDPR
jgi:hypothetical protein